jgi:hypothetical protein
MLHVVHLTVNGVRTHNLSYDHDGAAAADDDIIHFADKNA